MAKLIVVSHPEVVVSPDIPITDWRLSELGRSRAILFGKSKSVCSVGAIWSSTERKALETASIIAAPAALDVALDPELGENDRSATGYLPSDQFESAANAFFAEPHISFRGWETALAAQGRIVRAVTSIAEGHTNGDLLVVTHGAVGTLLWCHLKGATINRRFDQPGQGHFWTADLETLRPDFAWRPIT